MTISTKSIHAHYRTVTHTGWPVTHRSTLVSCSLLLTTQVYWLLIKWRNDVRYTSHEQAKETKRLSARLYKHVYAYTCSHTAGRVMSDKNMRNTLQLIHERQVERSIEYRLVASLPLFLSLKSFTTFHAWDHAMQRMWNECNRLTVCVCLFLCIYIHV